MIRVKKWIVVSRVSVSFLALSDAVDEETDHSQYWDDDHEHEENSPASSVLAATKFKSAPACLAGDYWIECEKFHDELEFRLLVTRRGKVLAVKHSAVNW